MKRFCSANQLTNMKTLSDVRNKSFGEHYGTLITSLPMPLLCRAIFVVDGNGTIQHVEYVKEIATEPDYDAAIKAVEKLAAG